VSGVPVSLDSLPPEARDVQIVALCDRAIADLREARTIEEVQRIGAIAEAMAAYARKLRAAMTAQNAAEKVVLLAEQRIGAELKAAQERGEVATQAKGGANIPHGVRGADTVATLPDLGLSRQRAAEAKALAALGENAITEAAEAATKTGRRLSKRDLLRRARAARPPAAAGGPPGLSAYAGGKVAVAAAELGLDRATAERLGDLAALRGPERMTGTARHLAPSRPLPD
jgi:hypothetical protein